MTCPHLTEELANIARMYTHLDTVTLDRIAVHHQWHCTHCGGGYVVPRWLPRDPHPGEMP